MLSLTVANNVSIQHQILGELRRTGTHRIPSPSFQPSRSLEDHTHIMTSKTILQSALEIFADVTSDVLILNLRRKRCDILDPRYQSLAILFGGHHYIQDLILSLVIDELETHSEILRLTERWALHLLQGGEINLEARLHIRD